MFCFSIAFYFVKRGEVEYIVTPEVLFALYQKAFLQSSQEDLKVIADLSNEVADACTQATTVDLKNVNAKLVEVAW